MSSILAAINLPSELGQFFLKVGIAKYIEAAGATPAEKTVRASAIKAVATTIDGAVLGSTTVGQLLTAAETELASKNMSISNQIIVQGLVSLAGQFVPAIPAQANLITATLTAQADLFLKDVISVCTTFGA